MTDAMIFVGYNIVGGALYVVGRYFGWWPWYIEMTKTITIDDTAHPHWRAYFSRRPLTAEEKAPIVSTWAYGDKPTEGDWFFGAILASVLWPATLVFSLFRRLGMAADRARTGKLKLRSELEKELAAAKAEIDSLLNPKP